MRGMLSEEIKQKSQELLGYEITQQNAQSKKYNAFAYIEQMRSFGQPIEHLPYYKEWCEWQKQQGDK